VLEKEGGQLLLWRPEHAEGEVASRLELAWGVLIILAMPLVNEHLAGGVIALTMVLVGAWGDLGH